MRGVELVCWIQTAALSPIMAGANDGEPLELRSILEGSIEVMHSFLHDDGQRWFVVGHVWQ